MQHAACRNCLLVHDEALTSDIDSSGSRLPSPWILAEIGVWVWAAQRAALPPREGRLAPVVRLARTLRYVHRHAMQVSMRRLHGQCVPLVWWWYRRKRSAAQQLSCVGCDLSMILG